MASSSLRVLQKVTGINAHKVAIAAALSENQGQFIRAAAQVLNHRLGSCNVTAQPMADGTGQAVLAVTVTLSSTSQTAKDYAAGICREHFSNRPLFSSNHQFGRTRTIVTVVGADSPVG